MTEMLADRRSSVTRARDPTAPTGGGSRHYAWTVGPPTGEQLVLRCGVQEAVVCEVGATLRHYSVGGKPICWGFSEGESSTGGRGQVLAPWPNRLEDGIYEHGGANGRAALDEPSRANAIHGLVRWLAWRPVERSERSVRLACMLFPQPAYPFSVALELTYSLTEEGLVVRSEATNVGASTAPFGLGFHNYLDAGADLADGCQVAVPARTHLVVDDRMLPIGTEPVAGTAFERVAGVGTDRPALSDLVLDDCFTDLDLGADGRWSARFAPGGNRAEEVVLWADQSFRWVMLYSGDTLEVADRRRGIAIEPMTCPANALRTKEGLVILDPGETFSASWGLRPAVLGSQGRA